VRLADVLARRGESLSTAAACMRRYPQVLINVPVSHKPPLDEIRPVQLQLERSRAALGDGSRILLRYSGTENLARVMIEGSDAAEIERQAHAIAATIRDAIT
jgi:phosphoglucosamine mutase